MMSKQRENGDRRKLNDCRSAEEFVSFYYRKEELTAFCREKGLPSSGSKAELNERIIRFLLGETGGEETSEKTKERRGRNTPDEITPDTVIEEGIVCSERHRTFFKSRIGKSFTFKTAFQNWLKSNAGKTYGDAVEAYREICEKAKTERTVLSPQFEYNAYIRAFFDDNKGRTMKEAILCWNRKKTRAGSHAYEREDLKVLEETKEGGF